MRINEMHTELAKITDHFTLINSMTHPGAINNHFDAMHNLLSGQSTKRVQEGVTDDQPYLGSFVAKHKPSTRNIVSNAWLIKCVGPPVFCAPNIGIGGYIGEQVGVMPGLPGRISHRGRSLMEGQRVEQLGRSGGQLLAAGGERGDC